MVVTKKTGKGNRTEHGTIGPHRPKKARLEEHRRSKSPTTYEEEFGQDSVLETARRGALCAPRSAQGCQQMITDTTNIRDLRQWVCWRSEERDGKPTKVPYVPHRRARQAAQTPRPGPATPRP